MRLDRCTLTAVVLAILALGITWIAGGQPGAEAATAKPKVAMILPGAIHDADWNSVGYVGLQEVAKAYDLQVSHSENVPIGRRADLLGDVACVVSLRPAPPGSCPGAAAPT